MKNAFSFTILVFLFTISSCNYALLVKKENVITVENGFILKTESDMSRDFFIPAKKINKEYVQDFNTKNLKFGFVIALDNQYLQDMKTYESTWLKNEMGMSKDSAQFFESLNEFSVIDKFQIFPIEMRYEKSYDKRVKGGSFIREQTILVNGNKIEFEYLEYPYRVLDIYPLFNAPYVKFKKD